MQSIDTFWKHLEQQEENHFENLGHAFLFDVPLYSDFTPEIEKITNFILEGKNFSQDLIFFNGKELTIDEVRKLEQFFSYKAFGNFKIAVIENMDQVPHTSFHSILKVLEEPPKDSLFILTTSKIHKLPLTVLSRVQKVFVPLEIDEKSFTSDFEFFKAMYPGLIKEIDEITLLNLEKAYADSKKMDHNKSYLPLISFVYEQKKIQNVLDLSLVFFYFLLQKQLQSASITKPHYKGLIKLLRITEEVHNQSSNLTHHHFQYPWYARSLLKL